MDNNKKSAEGILKKVLLSVSIVVVLLVGVFIIINLLNTNRNANQNQQYAVQPQDAQEYALRAEIDELRAIIDSMSEEYRAAASPNQMQETSGQTPEAVAGPAPTPTPTPTPTAEQSPGTASPGSDASPSPGSSGQSDRAISLERAIEIAYEDIEQRGINATYRSHSGLSLERGQWVWELLFRTQGERAPLIEYYINADDGTIVKFEWDD